MICGRVDLHSGHWVTTRALFSVRKRWCSGEHEIEGGNPARRGRVFGAKVTVDANGKRSKW